MSVHEDLNAIEAWLERKDAEIARLRAEVERLRDRCMPSRILMLGDRGHYVSEAVAEAFAARDRVIEAAFKALSDIETQLDGNDDRLGIMATTDGYYAWHSDEDYVKAREQAAEARRLRAELEGK